MTRAAAARGVAIAIAVAAAIDPAIPMPRADRPVVRVVAPDGRDVTPVTDALRGAGFIIDPAGREAATVLIASHGIEPRSTDHPVWALDTTPRAPNVRIVRAQATGVRFPGQAVEVNVTVHADGLAGQTTELLLEERGIPVAAARHQWADGDPRWQASLYYLPPGAAATRLRVRASAASGESSADDNAADVAVAPVRGPIRALIVEAAVTWPAMFTRRALEGEPAFAVSSLQRASKAVATRAGGPPPVLTRGSLHPFELVLVGGPDTLGAADLDALRWFVEERGGVVIFIPDQRPSGRYVDLVGVPSFASRAVDAPVPLGPDLLASEFLIPSALPAAATVLAADASGNAVVFSARRGAGAVVFSGALDAWRHRLGPARPSPGDEPFARFWRQVLVAHAAAAPPALDVQVDPAILRPGQRTTIAVRIRETEMASGGAIVALPSIAARVVGPTVKVDELVRLWPTVEPGVYEGEWRGRRTGRHNLTVVAGGLRGDTTIDVTADAAHGSGSDPEALALVASASGGEVFPIDQAPGLVDAMRVAYPPRRVLRPSHPMRSPWWVVPFAGLLCAEWAVRRKRGLP